MFHRGIARVFRFEMRRDRVDVFRRRRKRQVCASATGDFHDILEQLVRSRRTISVDHRLYGLHPFTGFYGI